MRLLAHALCAYTLYLFLVQLENPAHYGICVVCDNKQYFSLFGLSCWSIVLRKLLRLSTVDHRLSVVGYCPMGGGLPWGGFRMHS